MKKVLIAVGVAALILLIAVVYFRIRFNQMRTTLANHTITEVDLSTIPDGTYKGSFSAFIQKIDLDVTVKNHQITDINVIKQRCGKGYDGQAVIDRVKKEQKLDVDVKTGATGSSISILIALERAFATAGK